MVDKAATLYMCTRNVSVRIPVDALVILAKLFYGSSQPLEVQCRHCISKSPHTFTIALQLLRHKPTTKHGTCRPLLLISSDCTPILCPGTTSTTNFTAVFFGTCRNYTVILPPPSKEETPLS